MSAGQPSTEYYFLVEPRNEGIVRGEIPHYHRTSRQQIRNLVLIVALGIVGLIAVRLVFALGDPLASFGVSALATVVERYTEFESQMDGRATEYHLIYEFEAEGETYRTDQWVTPTLYNRYFAGDVLTIRYLPANPNDNEISEARSISFAPILCLGGVGLGVLVIFSLYQFKQNQKLRRSVLVEGVVIRSERLIDTLRKPYVRLTFGFDAPNGERVESSTLLKGERWMGDQPPAQGVKVYVLYTDDRTWQIL